MEYKNFILCIFASAQSTFTLKMKDMANLMNVLMLLWYLICMYVYISIYIFSSSIIYYNK